MTSRKENVEAAAVAGPDHLADNYFINLVT